MAITPQAGYIVDPNNPNGVIKDPNSGPPSPFASNAPNISYGAINTNPTPAPATVTKTSAPTNQSAGIAFTPLNTNTGSDPLLKTSPINFGSTPQTSSGVLGSSTSNNSPAQITTSSTTKTNTPSSPNTANADALASQAKTAAVNPLNDPNSPLAKNLADAAKNYQDLKDKIAQEYTNIESQVIPLGFQQGRAQVLAKQYANQLDNAQVALNTAQAAMGQAVTAYQAQTTAQNQYTTQTQPSSQYIQLPYSSQLVGAGGQTVGGGTSQSLNDAVNNQVALLQSGKIGFDDAKANLAGYGQGGLNALSQWAASSGFNVAQSNVLAAQQGSITPNLNYAQATLKNLKDAMSNLQVWGQNSNIPIVGNLANWYSSQSGQGKQQTSNKAGAVAEAQQAISAVLASVRGGTPTDYGSQSRAILPDDPTPADVAAAEAMLTTLGTQKQAIYSNPGQQPQNTNTGSGSIYSF